MYERLYGTLYDGKIVSFDLFGDTKQISEETDAFMRAVVDSAVISAFAEAPTIENGLSRQSAVTLGAVGVLIVLLIVYFVTTHSRNKREKQLRKETADRLAEYRRSKQDDESVGTGALRFVNETDHVRELSGVSLANFHAGVHRDFKRHRAVRRVAARQFRQQLVGHATAYRLCDLQPL